MSVTGYMGIGAAKQETKATAIEMKVGSVDMEKELVAETPKRKRNTKKVSDEE